MTISDIRNYIFISTNLTREVCSGRAGVSDYVAIVKFTWLMGQVGFLLREVRIGSGWSKACNASVL